VRVPIYRKRRASHSAAPSRLALRYLNQCGVSLEQSWLHSFPMDDEPEVCDER